MIPKPLIKNVSINFHISFNAGYYSDLKLQVARYPGDPWLDVKAGLKIVGPPEAEEFYVQSVECDVKIPVKYVRYKK